MDGAYWGQRKCKSRLLLGRRSQNVRINYWQRDKVKQLADFSYIVEPICGNLVLVLNLTSSDIGVILAGLALDAILLMAARVADARRDTLWLLSSEWIFLGSRRRSQACLSAWDGVILAAGSHSIQRRMKSRNRGSSQPFKAVTRSLEPGGPLILPRRDRPPTEMHIHKHPGSDFEECTHTEGDRKWTASLG